MNPPNPQNRPTAHLPKVVSVKKQATERKNASFVSAAPEIQQEYIEKLAESEKTGVPIVSAAVRTAVCGLCRSPYRADIEQRVQSGEKLTELARLYGCTTGLIRKHMTHLEVAERLEASVGSVTKDVQVWRTRVERMYGRLESMLDTIESGLIADMTPEGETILSKPTIAQIKPATDSMIKTMGEARQLIDLFGRVNGLFQTDVETGPQIHIHLPALVKSEPVTLDVAAKGTSTYDSSARILTIDGQVQGLGVPEGKSGIIVSGE